MSYMGATGDNGSRHLIRRGVALAAVTAMLTLSAANCGGDDDKKKPAAGASSAAPVTPMTGAAAGLQEAYEQTVAEVLPSVVQITSRSGLGSGVVYDTNGHIVTNAHVVGQDTQFDVALSTGSTVLRAKLVAAYAPDDLAVIKLEDPPKDLKPAAWADSSRLKVGRIVMAMGNPLGFSSSVTEGIVSATGRTVSEGSGGSAAIANAIQTSAAINHGNSGGALVDLDRQVVGIPTLAAADPQSQATAPGIGFAIPANTVKHIADQIIKDGKVTDSNRAALNISGRPLFTRSGEPVGVGVATVEPGGAAEKAGIKPGDTIVSVGDLAVTGMDDLGTALAARSPGDTVKVGIVRQNGDKATADATLGELKS
jgi:S1-C subfamily serine protease